MAVVVNFNDNGNVAINADGELFVIPNHAPTFKDFLFGGNKVFRQCEKLAGRELDLDKEHFIECWIVSKDLGSDNLTDHGFHIGKRNAEDLINCHGLTRIGRYIPESMFNNLKEGDYIDLHYNFKGLVGGEEKDIDLYLHTKLNQDNYRYRSFGHFEDALKYATAD